MPRMMLKVRWALVGNVAIFIAVFAAIAQSSVAVARTPTKINPPTKFIVAFFLKGTYSYDYADVDNGHVTEEHRTMTFEGQPNVARYTVYLNSKGKPFLSTTEALADPSPAMVGSWSVKASQTEEAPCAASGDLRDESTGRALTADFGIHDYDMKIQGAGDDSFVYTGTKTGSEPCDVPDPWAAWVVGNSHLNNGAEAFNAVLTVPQAKLRAANRGQSQTFNVALLPVDGLPSTDCGSEPALGISCKQSFNWSGTVVITGMKKKHHHHHR
ncbi:MAG: hypothetical protein WB507_11070 [Solirubrobacterales bacterium]